MSEELKILILEDTATDAELMVQELLKEGLVFSSRVVETRESFTKELKDFNPDLILADYKLPQYDGLSALKITREKCPDVPFIFVSGTIGEELAVEALKSGATDYVLKDHLSKLILSVHRALKEVKEHKRRKRMEKIQTSLYKISEAVHFTENLETLFRSIHESIAEIISASNFYIALYDPDHKSFVFPYFVDEEEENPGRQKLGKGLTEYVFRTGKSLLASPEVFMDLEKAGEVESIGPPSVDWLGIPLKTKEKTIGVMTVQSYSEGIRYIEEDKNMLTFMAEQVAISIERKQTEEQIKASLKEKEIMLREIHHRVKNNMQIISSLLRLQSKQLKDKMACEMFKVSQNRIRSMAFIHESLYKSEDLSKIDFADYIKRLTTHLLSIYSQTAARVKLGLDVGGVYLDITRAIPCGLVINELVSNSLKHAFPEGMKGKIIIKMHSEKRGKYILIVRDTGVGFPEGLDFSRTETLGMQLVNDLVKQIEGAIKLDREGGATFTIKF